MSAGAKTLSVSKGWRIFWGDGVSEADRVQAKGLWIRRLLLE